jgi:prepilin-type N-terminal cleavage/methylation domain-containing protein
VTRRNQLRDGFTLVELMVVLAIIVVLVSLLMAGFSAVRITQQERATDDIVRKLQVAIEAQRTELVSQAAKDKRDRSATFNSVLAYCDNDVDRAEALLVYLKLRHAFPQTYPEATTAVGLINWPAHKAYAALPNVATWNAHDQSAAILFQGLTNLATGGATFPADDVTSSYQMDHTVNGVTARVFRDARGMPIGFRRFYESAELNAAPYTNTKSSSLDPFDPLGKLAGWMPTPSTKKTDAQSAVGVTFSINNKSITAYSFGQDKTGGTADDVFGYRLFKLGNQGSIK